MMKKMMPAFGEAGGRGKKGKKKKRRGSRGMLGGGMSMSDLRKIQDMIDSQ